MPQLRFAGFVGEWEEGTLGDLGSVSMNRRIYKEETSEIGDVPFYKIGTFGGQADSFISRDLFEEYKSKYPYPKIGDLLISASGSIGKVIEYKGEDAYYQDSNIVWLDINGKIKNSFLKQYYSTVNWNELEGSTIKRLYNKDLLRKQIFYPILNEQEKIGDLFRKIDALIEKQEGKVSKMEDFKKSMLQKTFPQKGKLVPDFRFEGFDGKWEKEKLNNITSKFDNLRIPIKESLRTKGPYPYHGATGIQDYVDDYIFDGEYILIAEDGASDINNYPLQRTSGRFWVNNHAHVIQAKDGNNNDFIFYSLPQINFEQYLVGGTRKKLNSSSMDEILLLLPSKEEQQKIGQFFKNLDTQIEAEEKLLESYKQMKKSLLQKMFV